MNNCLALYATGNIGGNSITNVSSGTEHNGGSIYLASDGHVKYLLPTLVSGGCDAVTSTAGVAASTTVLGVALAGCPGAAGTNSGSGFAMTFSKI